MAEDAQALQYSETVLQALKEFADSSEKALNPVVHQATELIAKTGLSCYPWDLVKQLLAHELGAVLDEHNANSPLPTFTEDRNRLVSLLLGFIEAPFTVQRLCELILRPRFYSTTKKFVFAVDKLLSVTTIQHVIDPDTFHTQVIAQTTAMMALKNSPTNIGANGATGGGSGNTPQSPGSNNDASPPATPMPQPNSPMDEVNDVSSSAMQVDGPVEGLQQQEQPQAVAPEGPSSTPSDAAMDVDNGSSSTSAPTTGDDDSVMDVDKPST